MENANHKDCYLLSKNPSNPFHPMSLYILTLKQFSTSRTKKMRSHNRFSAIKPF